MARVVVQLSMRLSHTHACQCQVTRLYTDWLNCLFCCPCSKDQDPLPLLGLWSLGDDGQLTKAKGCWTKGQEAIAFRTYRVSSLHQGFVEV